MNDIRLNRSFDIEAPAAAMWPLVSDSSRMGGVMGLDPMTFSSHKEASGRVRHEGKSTFLGQVATWDEHPAEWVEGQRFSILRVFHQGPIVQTHHTVTLTATGAGTCRVEMDWRGSFRSSVVFFLFRNVVAPRWTRAWGTLFRQLGRFATGAAAEIGQDAAFSPRPEVVAAAQPARALLKGLGASDVMLDKLVAHLASRPDDELMRIRPCVLCTRLGITGMQALKLCLFATRHGLLTMRWDLLCPHCQGAKVTSDSLTGVRDVGACESCGIQFDAQFDRNVEVTFRPASAVRKVDAPRFCFGGPHLTPHVRLQQELQPQETRTLSMQLAPGRYRVRAQGVPGSTTLEVEKGDGAAQVNVVVDPVNVSVEPARVKGSQLTLQVANQCAEVTPLALETSKWLETACTAATVTSLMEFRDLFSNELLAPGQGIQVGQVTLMFTDLKGSTRMYEQIGDVKAFALVRDHFTVLSECIRQADGGIVKTIGDAIMAVFDSPSRALRCALEIQHRAKDIKPMDDHAVVIKIGLHTGPCIAVQQNEHLDYFGNMVNVAARAQNESVGWDIVLTEAMVRDPECAKLVTTVPGEMFETELKGIAARVRLLRLWPEGKPSA